MKFTAFLTAAFATIATAIPHTERGLLPNLISPVPGYPLGNPLCLNDAQANFIVSKFQLILTAPDRQVANATAQSLLAEGYVEESDSINFLAGFPLGGPSFVGKQQYIFGVTNAPAFKVDTLEVFHDCNRISWRWNASKIGINKYPVKGFNTFTVNSPAKGQVQKSYIEFSSIAWGQDIGWVCTAPAGGAPQ